MSTIHRILAFAVIVLLAWGHAGPAGAADPFYDRLLEDGIEAHDRGDHSAAVKILRLACFGLLDEPDVLARGLTYLALAQAALDDQAAFAGTFDRLLEVERRFGAYSQLDLEADQRQVLEGHLERWIAFEVLDREPAFREAGRRRLGAQLVDLAAEERWLMLQRLAAAEPGRTTWALQLAELELERGDFQAALAAAGQALSHDPGLIRASCLRGRAGAAIDLCEQAIVDLESCEGLETPRSLAVLRLRCLIRLGDWPRAATLLDEVPRASQRKAPFRQFAREIKRGLKTTSVAVPPETGARPAVGPAELGTSPPDLIGESAVAESAPDPLPPEVSIPEAALAQDAAALPADLPSELESLRQLLSSGSRAELEDALATARALADRHRQLAEVQHLAAEIAYRLSRWQEAVSFFERGGEPDPSQPDRLFYLAVALFESGDLAAARSRLEQCQPALEMTPFVRSYVEKIRPAGG